MISQIDELKKLVVSKASELGLNEGTVESILSTARDFSEKDYSRTHEIEYDRSFIDYNLGDSVFRELALRLGDRMYPCYEILLSKATGRRTRVPATETKDLTINWRLHGL